VRSAPRADAVSRPHALSILHGRPSLSKRAHQDRPRPPSPPGASGNTAYTHPSDQWEGTGAAVHTRSPMARTRHTRASGGKRLGPERLDVGDGPIDRCAPRETEPPVVRQQAYTRGDRAWAEAQPRCGVTLGGVLRRRQTLVPRARPAPDGRKSGGRQPTNIRVITRL